MRRLVSGGWRTLCRCAEAVWFAFVLDRSLYNFSPPGSFWLCGLAARAIFAYGAGACRWMVLAMRDGGGGVGICVVVSCGWRCRARRVFAWRRVIWERAAVALIVGARRGRRTLW